MPQSGSRGSSQSSSPKLTSSSAVAKKPISSDELNQIEASLQRQKIRVLADTADAVAALRDQLRASQQSCSDLQKQVIELARACDEWRVRALMKSDSSDVCWHLHVANLQQQVYILKSSLMHCQCGTAVRVYQQSKSPDCDPKVVHAAAVDFLKKPTIENATTLLLSGQGRHLYSALRENGCEPILLQMLHQDKMQAVAACKLLQKSCCPEAVSWFADSRFIARLVKLTDEDYAMRAFSKLSRFMAKDYVSVLEAAGAVSILTKSLFGTDITPAPLKALHAIVTSGTHVDALYSIDIAKQLMNLATQHDSVSVRAHALRTLTQIARTSQQSAHARILLEATRACVHESAYVLRDATVQSLQTLSKSGHVTSDELSSVRTSLDLVAASPLSQVMNSPVPTIAASRMPPSPLTALSSPEIAADQAPRELSPMTRSRTAESQNEIGEDVDATTGSLNLSADSDTLPAKPVHVSIGSPSMQFRFNKSADATSLRALISKSESIKTALRAKAAGSPMQEVLDHNASQTDIDTLDQSPIVGTIQALDDSAVPIRSRRSRSTEASAPRSPLSEISSKSESGDRHASATFASEAGNGGGQETEYPTTPQSPFADRADLLISGELARVAVVEELPSTTTDSSHLETNASHFRNHQHHDQHSQQLQSDGQYSLQDQQHDLQHRSPRKELSSASPVPSPAASSVAQTLPPNRILSDSDTSAADLQEIIAAAQAAKQRFLVTHQSSATKRSSSAHRERGPDGQEMHTPSNDGEFRAHEETPFRPQESALAGSREQSAQQRGLEQRHLSQQQSPHQVRQQYQHSLPQQQLGQQTQSVADGGSPYNRSSHTSASPSAIELAALLHDAQLKRNMMMKQHIANRSSSTATTHSQHHNAVPVLTSHNDSTGDSTGPALSPSVKLPPSSGRSQLTTAVISPKSVEQQPQLELHAKVALTERETCTIPLHTPPLKPISSPAVGIWVTPATPPPTRARPHGSPQVRSRTGPKSTAVDEPPHFGNISPIPQPERLQTDAASAEQSEPGDETSASHVLMAWQPHIVTPSPAAHEREADASSSPSGPTIEGELLLEDYTTRPVETVHRIHRLALEDATLSLSIAQIIPKLLSGTDLSLLLPIVRAVLVWSRKSSNRPLMLEYGIIGAMLQILLRGQMLLAADTVLQRTAATAAPSLTPNSARSKLSSAESDVSTAEVRSANAEELSGVNVLIHAIGAVGNSCIATHAVAAHVASHGGFTALLSLCRDDRLASVCALAMSNVVHSLNDGEIQKHTSVILLSSLTQLVSRNVEKITANVSRILCDICIAPNVAASLLVLQSGLLQSLIFRPHPLPHRSLLRCSAALAGLAQKRELHENFVMDIQGLEMLQRLLELQVPQVTTNCLSTVYCLVSEGAQHRAVLSHALFQQILSSLQAPDETHMRAATYCIRAIAADDTLSDQLLSQLSLELLLDRPLLLPDTAAAVGDIVTALASNERRIQVLVAVDTVEQLCAVLTRLGEENDAVFAILQAINSLCSREAGKQRLLACGGLDAILYHIAAPVVRVQAAAANVLTYICADGEVADHMLRVGVLDVLLAAVSECKDGFMLTWLLSILRTFADNVLLANRMKQLGFVGAVCRIAPVDKELGIHRDDLVRHLESTEAFPLVPTYY
eukprot:TRINITY_DN9356_c0_g1_i2.p1 TRINITY_DN9356_c0_g1~~TRINITY_DN9356_c0_g1_i2.p1  ORF type:complete len:1646 (+),score=386.12 TRINITY_DN9356_c0_g1_i2:106-5043(+)